MSHSSRVSQTSIPPATNLKLTPMYPITLSLCLSVLGAVSSNAQYSLQTCESTKLIRCQQDVLRDLHAVSINSASIQHPISGPPYSPKQQFHAQQQAQLVVNPSTCRLVRSNLDCLLTTTPACYDQGIQTAQNTDVILRAKRFLEQSGCNEPDTTWQSTFCFRSPEVRSCEERYGFTSFGASAPLLVSNITACLNYHAFKYCVDTHLRLNCKVHEMDMANEYLIDKASDLAWRCPVNATGSLGYNANYLNDPYRLSNSPGLVLAPSSYGHYGNYEQRILPTYVGGSNLGPLREQSWERFNDPRLSRYPDSISATGDITFDRLVDTDNSDCAVKASPYARECDDKLMEQHRLARDSRDGNELQRRMCWCTDSSVNAVEILMGQRKRDMIRACRGVDRNICSGALRQAIHGPTIIIFFTLVASLLASKHLGPRH